MTIPFLKNKEAAVVAPIEHISMGHEDEEKEEEYGMLDAISEDLMHAFEKKNIKMIKSALESLCEHIMEIDEQQDHEEME